ncbi:Protein PIN-LIKES 1, partial [Mucuna pruriens]
MWDLYILYSGDHCALFPIYQQQKSVEKEDTMQLWKLFITALMPVLKVLLVTAVGAFLAMHRFNILRNTARKHLNTVNLFLSFLFPFLFTTSTIYAFPFILLILQS